MVSCAACIPHVYGWPCHRPLLVHSSGVGDALSTAPSRRYFLAKIAFLNLSMDVVCVTSACPQVCLLQPTVGQLCMKRPLFQDISARVAIAASSLLYVVSIYKI